MEPAYMKEVRYSYLVASYRAPRADTYQTETPETAFEKTVQALFTEGQAHLHHEEYLLALNSFRELMALILHTANPKMPLDPNSFVNLVFPFDAGLVDALASKAAGILKATPAWKYDLPSTVVSEQPILPEPVVEKLGMAFKAGVQLTSYHGVVSQRLAAASAAATNEEFALAIRHYALALDAVPDGDRLLRGSLLHDMAVLSEKAGDKTAAEQRGSQALELLAASGQVEAHVQALDSVTGIFQRDGKADQADGFARRATELRGSHNVHVVASPQTSIGATRLGRVSTRRIAGAASTRVGGALEAAAGTGIESRASREAAPLAATGEAVRSPQLMALTFIKPEAATKTFTAVGHEGTASFVLDGNAAANARNFLQTIATTADLGLLTGYLFDPVQMVAYLPHMYFFAIPMAMGDSLAGMGNLQQAANQYLAVLPYPFINRGVEIVKVWTRLAQAYIDLSDAAYRRAKDDTAKYAEARAFYENVVLANRTLKANSPLYADAQFAAIKTRVTQLLAAADPLAVNENPTITTIVLQALGKLGQIEQGLNFFGFGPDYTPPFSFQYLQNTARYFAQHASQTEQRYIQFKSQAESEELRREQLDQQAEVAAQTVVLEQRGVAEAQAGLGVAQANLNYAEVQRVNAVQSKADFEAVRWELLEYAALEAWSSAASMDEDDEVKQTISDRTYYNADSRKRSHVLYDLAIRRTRVSHDLEAKKLQRAIASAEAYKGVAQAQVVQANSRIAVAQQRVQIAALQQRQAEENRDFLDMREFGSRLWYELASQARRITRRYVDMATETAFLMERAYNAETERGLGVVRFDYSSAATNDLLAADLLLADIDYFTYDYVTTVRTKKNPVKTVISLADSHAMAFQQLQQAGRCTFSTELADFDRQHPGLYLCKLQNVEVVFVGLTGTPDVAGTLRNVGVSAFRRGDGGIVTRMYPADVMVLSRYETRQDALAFRFEPNDLRLFENNGIETLWQLDLPLDANGFDFRDILDVQLVLYFDGFFSPTLEATVRAALPATGTASRGISLGMTFPDELFYLKNKGEARVSFDGAMFPMTQKEFVRNSVALKVTGKTGAVGGLTLRLTSAVHGAELVLTTDAQGEVNAATAGDPLSGLAGESLFDHWTLTLTSNDNPALVEGGVLDLGGLDDVWIFFEYAFRYR